MPPPSYQIDLRPCIPVRCGKHIEYVGLRELLTDAHRIDDLALPLPPAQSGLYRVLAAICATVTELDDPDQPIKDWLDHRTELLRREDGFDTDTVHAYFDADPGSFDLFHPTRPWWQDSALAIQCAKRSGINSLIYGRAAGRNLVWFNPRHTDTDPEPVPTREALWSLLAYHYYGPSGRATARTVEGITSGQLKAGPLRSTVSFHPRGRTLYETLLLHQTPYRGDDQAPGSDACPWQEPPAHPLRTPHAATWPKRLLTGRSVHAALLVPDASGEHVTDAYLTWASQHCPLEATDPYLVYDIDPKTPAERRRSPRRADADHALFRALPALALAGDEHRPGCRPEAFTTINSLPKETRSSLRVWVCGFDQEGQVNNRIWYTSLTPPIWPLAQENDPVKASRIVECCSAAETLGAALRRQADQAWKDTGLTPPPAKGGGKRDTSFWASQALASYWPSAEQAFWELIDDTRSAYGVFAATAITALSETTRDALNRLPNAGPALARAVQSLRRSGTPPDDTLRPTKGPHAQP